MKTYKRIYKKTGNTAKEVSMSTNTKKRSKTIKTSMKNINYGAGTMKASGYKTKLKYDKSGKLKKAKTKRMGSYKTLSM